MVQKQVKKQYCYLPGGSWRYSVLFLLCYTSFAQYFCIELPSGLQETIIKVFKITSKEYNLLFSAHTWPDVVMSIGGGILVDRVVGIRAGYLIVTVIGIVGQGLMALGAFMNTFHLIVAGRFVLGCGMGTLQSIGNVFLGLWFKNKEVSFAMSFTFCACRLAASLGLVLPHMIYTSIDELLNLDLPAHNNNHRVGFTFLFGFLLLFSSLIACILIILLDTIGAAKHIRESYEQKRFNIKDLKDFSVIYWLSITAHAAFYSVLYVFVANGQLYFVSKFGFSTQEANFANFLVFATPIPIIPIIGILIDMLGFNVLWGICGALLVTITHILFNLAERQWFFYPYLLTSLLSLGYSFFCTAVYVLPLFIVQEHQLTTAYSFFHTIYSIAFTTSSIVSGTIIDLAGYMWLELFFTLILFGACFFLFAVAILDCITIQERKFNVPGKWTKEMHKYYIKKKFQLWYGEEN